MSVEQVARDFILQMGDKETMNSMVTPGAMASGGILPQPIPIAESMKVMDGFMVAFPDLKFEVQQVTVNGDQATVHVTLNGMNSGPLALPGMPAFPPTGKRVSVKDTFVVTVQGDKVSHMEVASPADGGIPAMLAQLGVQMPSM